MSTEKKCSILLFVFAGILLIFSIGLYIWVGIDSSNQISAKIACSVLLDLVVAGLLYFGIKLIKNKG